MLKILIVDDDAEIQEIFAYVIKKKGDEAICVLSGEDLVSTIVKTKPAIIILDVMLQEYNGRDLCRELKAHPETAHIPIILTSANTSMLKDYEECNTDEVIEKPFNLHDVYSKINKVLYSKA